MVILRKNLAIFCHRSSINSSLLLKNLLPNMVIRLVMDKSLQVVMDKAVMEIFNQAMVKVAMDNIQVATVLKHPVDME